MELFLHNQPAMSFMKSTSRILSINQWQRMTPFYPHLLLFFLTYLVILPSLILHVYLCLWMHPLLIICRTKWMLVHHPTTEGTNHSLKTHLILHLLFPQTQRANILSSHLPLCVIHQIIRMLTNILNFLIFVVVIYLLLHLIMMMIQSLLIRLRH